MRKTGAVRRDRGDQLAHGHALRRALPGRERASPFRGRMKAPARLHAPAAAARSAASPTTPTTDCGARHACSAQSFTRDSLSARLRQPAAAAHAAAPSALGRIPRGRGIYLTEFGFQTNPPDRKRGPEPRHARARDQRGRPAVLRRPAGARRWPSSRSTTCRAEARTSLQHRAAARPTAGPSRRWAPTGCRSWSRPWPRRGVEVWGQVRPAHGRVARRRSSCWLASGGHGASHAPGGHQRQRLLPPQSGAATRPGCATGHGGERSSAT